MESQDNLNRTTKYRAEMKRISPSDIHVLSEDIIYRNIKILLSDDSHNNSYLKIISSSDYRPQSFTIGERESSLIILDENERHFESWCNSLINDHLNRLSESEEISFINVDEVINVIKSNLTRLLEYKIKGETVKDVIWNQEFTDIVWNIVKYSLFGDTRVSVSSHKEYNDLARKIVPELIRRNHIIDLNLLLLLKLSIASGSSALDLKGSYSASSLLSNKGIPLKNYLHKPLDETLEYYYKELLDKSNSPTPIFHWEMFIEMLSVKRDVFIVYFTDDNFETYFDFLFLQKLLMKYQNTSVVIIPKNGTFGTDTSFSYIYDYLLTLDIYRELNDYIKMQRLSICSTGPRMGAVNINKLSKEVIHFIGKSDLVMIKGCRSHELIQGGLNKPSFTSYIVIREMSERVSGLDARETPLIFFYLSPGEFAFYGFRIKNLRTKTFSSSREIIICESTLEDHNRRCLMGNPTKIINEIEIILKSKNNFYDDFTPVLKEANQLAEKLIYITKKTYDNLCRKYANIRWEEPHELDKKMWDCLLKFAREKVKLGQIGDKNGILTLLDVGTGSGRDIRYAIDKLGINVIGIDNSDGFIEMLKTLEIDGKIPKGSYIKADMRDLSCFTDNKFDIIRHNATLLHLPIIGKGYMIDLALAESFRVLKNHGLIFIFVKEGQGLKFVDTKEGLGGRVFQFFTKELIEKLVTRNGFSVLWSSKEMEYRNKQRIPWIAVIAEKLSNYANEYEVGI